VKILKLRLLGTCELTVNDKLINNFGYEKVKALLGYLATEANTSHNREEIATMFWPELSTQAARVNLRRALANLRIILGESKDTNQFLASDRQTLRFNYSQADEIDLWDFQKFANAIDRKLFTLKELCPNDVAKLEKAVSLYKGLFLSEVRIYDSEMFDDWLRLKRQQLHQQAVDACTMLLVHYEKQRSLPDVYRSAQKLLELEPWNATAHESLIKLLANNQKRSAALQQYQSYQQVLDRELGAKPEPAMVKLYERIREGI
jgi:DNA-binding SARP family transcriptional activator